jgi:type IV pilus assembly protein PilO
MTVTRKWSLLALLLVVAIFAAGWFLLISPKRGEAADLRSQTTTQEDANARLQDKIRVLMAQQEDLPQKRARLAVIRTRIPDNPSLPSLVRDLTAAGRKVGATIDAMSPSLPVAAAPVAPAPVATGTTGEAAPAAPAATAASLYHVPLQLEVSGSYFELEQFVNKLEGLSRSFLVTGFTMADGGDETAGGLQLSLQGRVFMAPPVAAAAVPTTTDTTADASAPAAQ